MSKDHLAYAVSKMAVAATLVAVECRLRGKLGLEADLKSLIAKLGDFARPECGVENLRKFLSISEKIEDRVGRMSAAELTTFISEGRGD